MASTILLCIELRSNGTARLAKSTRSIPCSVLRLGTRFSMTPFIHGWPFEQEAVLKEFLLKLFLPTPYWNCRSKQLAFMPGPHCCGHYHFRPCSSQTRSQLSEPWCGNLVCLEFLVWICFNYNIRLLNISHGHCNDWIWFWLPLRSGNWNQETSGSTLSCDLWPVGILKSNDHIMSTVKVFLGPDGFDQEHHGVHQVGPRFCSRLKPRRVRRPYKNGISV